MKCPNFTDFQSQHKAQKRIDQAIDSLGEGAFQKRGQNFSYTLSLEKL